MTHKIKTFSIKESSHGERVRGSAKAIAQRKREHWFFALLTACAALVVLGIALADLMVLACIAYDAVARGKVHSAWLRRGLLLVLSQIAPLAVAQTTPWLAFAG